LTPFLFFSNTEIGGPHQEKMNTRDIIVRNNTYRNVIKGPSWDLNLSGTNILLPATTGHIGRVALVTVSDGTPHGLAVGDEIFLEGYAVNFYQITVQITSVPRPDQFAFATAVAGVIEGIFVPEIDQVVGGQRGPNILRSGINYAVLRVAVMVTLPSGQAHGLTVGNRVKLDVDVEAFNHSFEVTGVPRPDLFTVNSPATEISGTVTSIRKLDGVEKLLIHDNTIELFAGTPVTPPVGIYLDDTGAAPAPHGQAVLRNNRFRYLDGVTGSFNGYAIQVNGTNAVIISDNLIETVPAGIEPIQTLRCNQVTHFDNRIVDTILLDVATDQYREQLDLPAEDALVSACFDK
jgi:hypothetical protein